MKIGFSSRACPGWDLETIVSKAASLGFDGVELHGLRGESHLPLVPALAGHPEQVRSMLSERKVELVCLSTSASLSSRRRAEVARQKGIVVEFMELASRLGCPFVRLSVGEIDPRDDRQHALARIAESLISLIPAASRLNVTLLVENGGDFPGSADVWFLVDAASHPSIRCCWNQAAAMTAGERATNSVPRLGGKIGMVHVCDAEFDERGILLSDKPLGQGHVGVKRQIELLKGLVYRRYLMFECPRPGGDSPPEPDAVLPQVAEFLKASINAQQPILSAYKGDKNAPKLASLASLTAQN